MNSAINVINTTSGREIAADSVYPIPQIARRIGSGIDSNGEGVLINKIGYYKVSANITVTAGAAGVVTATLLKDGVPVPGSTAAVTAAEGDVVTLPISGMVRVNCCMNPSDLVVKIGGVAVTAYNASLVVVQR